MTSPFYDDYFPPKKEQRDPIPNPAPAPTDGSVSKHAAAAFDQELATLAGTTQGGRNNQLNKSGMNLAQLVASNRLDHDTVWRALHSTAVSIGLSSQESTNTLHSAFAAGLRQPRVVADLDQDIPSVTVLPPVLDKEDPEHAAAVDEAFPRIDWDKLWADESTDDWIIEPLLPARRLVALFSPPKVGKSLLMLELAVAISRGAPVLSRDLDEPRRVLYVDFENDPRGDIRSRLQAMEVGPQDLGNLVYLTFPRLPHLDTVMGGTTLLAVVEHYRCEVVVIDTISRAVGGDENDNDTWLSFYRNCGVRLKAAGVACIRLDHTGKDKTKGMRGGSAKYGDVDAVWAMSRIDEDTFQLECTDNRLPIGEKLLVLHRELRPLRHRVDGAGLSAAISATQEAIIADLDHLLGAGVGIGVNEAHKLLRANGHGHRKTAISKALEVRAARFTAPQSLPGMDE